MKDTKTRICGMCGREFVDPYGHNPWPFTSKPGKDLPPQEIDTCCFACNKMYITPTRKYLYKIGKIDDVNAVYREGYVDLYDKATGSLLATKESVSFLM